jgi:hypothetical protein
MGSHSLRTHWMYQYWFLYLAWWWRCSEPKNVAVIFNFNIAYQYMLCYGLNKLLYYCNFMQIYRVIKPSMNNTGSVLWLCFVRVGTHLCDSGDTPLWQCRHTFVTVGTHLCDSGNTPLWQWEHTFLTMGSHLCDSGNTPLWQWGHTFVTVRTHLCDSGDTPLPWRPFCST